MGGRKGESGRVRGRVGGWEGEWEDGRVSGRVRVGVHVHVGIYTYTVYSTHQSPLPPSQCAIPDSDGTG